MKRFSLLSLLLSVTVVAVGYSAWNQSRQANEINRVRMLLDASHEDLRISCRIVELLLHLEPDDAHTLDLLRPLIPPTPDPTLEPELQSAVRMLASTAQIADVDGIPGGLEILSLNTSITTIPGSSTSLYVLFSDDAIIDILTRSTGTRSETHRITLNDADNDQLIDLVVACKPGFKSSEPAKNLVYNASERGFTFQNADNGITMTSTEGREPSGLAVVESLARPR